MLKKLVDGIEVPLSPQEILDCEERERDHLIWLEAYEKVKYKDTRVAEYNKQGITNDARIDALWDRIIENNPTPSDEMQAKREKIKTDIPKPEK